MLTTDNCVHSIVEAFHRSLDVLRKLRRHRRSPGKASSAKDITKTQISSDELELSKSLRRSPADVQQEYDRYRAVNGERFALGDAIAQTSLAQTLLRLNTGLVNLISSLLNSGRDDRRLDYRALASLSDVSRREALDALSQLSLRLSQSAITLNQPSSHRTCHRCRETPCGHQCNVCSSSRPKVVPKKGRIEDRKMNSGAAREVRKQSSSAQIRRVHLSSASEPQLAMVKPRPKGRRTASSSSNQLPQAKTTETRPERSHKRHDSAQAHIESWSSANHEKKLPVPPTSKTMDVSPISTTPLNYLIPDSSSPPIIHAPPQPLNSVAQHDVPVQRRRLEKATPSTHTFLSASTKLGEIPMHRWNKPFDYAEMERMNAEYYAGVAQAKPVTSKPKRGLFGRMFGKKEKINSGIA